MPHRNKKMWWIVHCLLILSLNLVLTGKLFAFSNKPLVLKGNEGSVELMQYIQYYRNFGRQLTIDEVYSAFDDEPKVEFLSYSDSQRSINFGIDNLAHWHIFQLQNSVSDELDLTLELRNPNVDDIAIYVFSRGHVFEGEAVSREEPELIKGGNNQPFSSRTIKSNLFLFPLKIAGGESKTFLVRTKTQGTSYFPFILHIKNAYELQSLGGQLNFGIFLGIVVGLVVYNLFLFTKTRLLLYFYFILYSIITAISTLSRENYLFSLWPESSAFNSKLFVITPMLGVMGLFQLARYYVSTAKNFPRIDKIYKFFLFYTAFITVAMCFDLPNETIILVYGYPAFIMVYFLFYTSWQSYRRGNHAAIFFLIGVIPPMIAGVLKMSLVNGFIASTPLIEALITNAETLQLLIFSLGLAEIVNKLSVEAHKADQSAKAAKLLNDAKNTFLHRMSFRIRTPMNAVVGTTELLSYSNISTDHARFLKIISNSAKSLLVVMDDILDISRVREGRIVFVEKEFDLNEMIEDCMSVFALSATEKRLSFFSFIDDAVPVKLIGDTNRLRQILINLLSNAFKFTEHGAIQVVVRHLQVESPGSDCRLAIEVIDSGVGIASDKISSLFNAYTQIDESTARKYGGTGLGLTICKLLAGAMGGDIEAESQVGKGSIFRIVLTFKAGIDADEQLKQREQAMLALKGKKVLILGQGTLFIDAVIDYLESHNASVRLVTRHIILKDLAKDQCYDYSMIFMTEYTLPPSDIVTSIGEATREISLLIRLDDIKSAKARVETKTRYLGRPWSVNQVVDCLLSATHSASHHRFTELPSIQHEKQRLSRKLTILLVEDNGFCARVTKAMLNELGHQVILVEDGLHALEIYQTSCKKLTAEIDLILMDIEIPKMDGFQTTRAIRQWELTSGLKPIPIAAVSAHAMYEDKLKCTECGMNAHLGKPVAFHDLVNVLVALTDQSAERVVRNA